MTGVRCTTSPHHYSDGPGDLEDIIRCEVDFTPATSYGQYDIKFVRACSNRVACATERRNGLGALDRDREERRSKGKPALAENRQDIGAGGGSVFRDEGDAEGGDRQAKAFVACEELLVSERLDRCVPL